MPKMPVLDRQTLLERLLQRLSQVGPVTAKELCEWLGISQPAFSRIVGPAHDAIIRIKEGRHTLYAAYRSTPWGKPAIPVMMIDEAGAATRIAVLHPLAPQGFYLESLTSALTSKRYPGLPYFFEDMRPSGFLGRLVPRLHADLGLPPDITLWTDNHCLSYLTRYGWNLIGNLVLGETSYEQMLSHRRQRVDVIAAAERAQRYPVVAEQVLSHGVPGSSAAGEHPKFLAVVDAPDGLRPVLVKFSPPIADALSQRVADLLVCEHLAHDILKQYGHTAAQSSLLQGADRLFLEITRFDRTAASGRRGLISLRALDLEFVGQLSSWSETAAALARQCKIDQRTYDAVVWLDVFGKLIANSDRHHGNLSLFCEGETCLGLAPVYDMLPMLYAPQQNQIVARPFVPPTPKIFEVPQWNNALAAARDFWAHVQRHPHISAAFKAVTANNDTALAVCAV